MDAVADLHALVPADAHDDCESALRRRVHHGRIDVRPAPPGRYVVRDDRLYDDATAARRGAMVGAVVGGLIAAVAFAAGLLSAAPLPVWVLGAAALAAGVGAVVGLQLHEVLDDDPVTTLDVTAGEWCLVTVNSEHGSTRAHRVLALQGARLIEADVPQPIDT